MKKFTLLALLILMVPAMLSAQDWRNRRGPRDYASPYSLQNKFELTPFAGYAWGGTIYADQTNLFNQDVDVASSADFGASFAVPLRDGFKLEFLADRQNTHLETGSGQLFEPNNNVANFDITYYQAGLQIPFDTGRNVQPFIIVSAGVANLNPRISGVSSATRFAASVGGGVKVPITPNAGFRGEIRGFFTSLGNNNVCDSCYYGYSNNLYQGQANLGFYFAF